MLWEFYGKPITELPKSTFGFVYILHYEDGFKYVGMKSAFSTLEKPAKKSGEVREGCTRVSRRIMRDPETGKVPASKKDPRIA